MPNIYTKEYDLTLGDATVKLFIKSSNTGGINFINVHQNEVTSKKSWRAYNPAVWWKNAVYYPF